LIFGVPLTPAKIGERPGLVRTPPGKKSTSLRLGESPTGTSDGSSSVIHDPNILSGKGENVSIDMSYGSQLDLKADVNQFAPLARQQIT
jgi:hypothetical protein